MSLFVDRNKYQNSWTLPSITSDAIMNYCGFQMSPHRSCWVMRRHPVLRRNIHPKKRWSRLKTPGKGFRPRMGRLKKKNGFLLIDGFAI